MSRTGSDLTLKTAAEQCGDPAEMGRGLRPWRPGQSGNPGGRPKVNPELRKAAQYHSAEALDVLVEVMRTGKPGERLLAAREILDRAYGKPSQAVELADKATMTLVDLLAGLPSTVQTRG